jgi:4'-phosphopantetheinyl transferase
MARVPVDAWIVGLDAAAATATATASESRGDAATGAARRAFARVATRAILGYTLGVAAAEVEISRRCAHCGHPTHGKPALVGAPDVSFSVSHSADRALIAVSRGVEVGADIEVLRPRRYLDRLGRRVFAVDEYAGWERLPEGRQLEAFLAVWTAKEAYLKAIGKGVTVPLRDLTVPPGWTMSAIGVAGAVAHVAADGEVEVRTKAWHAPRVSASDGTAS